MAITSAGGAQAATGWQRPIQLATPVSLDVFGVQAAFSEQGAAAVGYGVMNVDSPASSDAFIVARSATGKRSGPKRISGAKEILALGWRGSHETLLTGTSESSQTCCSSAQTRLANGSGKHTIVSELAGATQGRLVSFAGRLLAVVGTERGVWVAQSDGKGHFGGTRKLSGSAVTVDAVDAVAAPQNDTVTAWASTGTGATPATTNAIVVGRGSAKAAPRSGRRLISLRAGHSIDELALAPAPARSGGATAVWVESWSDAAGNFHSVVMAADLTRSPRRHQLSSSRELAAGLNLAGDANGDQAAAWKSCDVERRVRRARHPPGRPWPLQLRPARLRQSTPPNRPPLPSRRPVSRCSAGSRTATSGPPRRLPGPRASARRTRCQRPTTRPNSRSCSGPHAPRSPPGPRARSASRS